MELADVEAFLVLAEELHFGRAAERTHVSAARVSQRIKALERQVGGTLFERTSRRVRLTPLGARMRAELRPAYAALTDALAGARSAARDVAGFLRVGATTTTCGPELDRLVVAFERDHPDCRVEVRELPLLDPLSALRDGDVDVLVNWLVLGDHDLTMGPVIARQPRVVAVAADHPLAARDEVSAEMLGDHLVVNCDALGPFLAAIRRVIVPEVTPSGRPVRVHPTPLRTMTEGLSLVARGQAIHPTVASLERQTNRHDIVFRPIVDLPPLPLGLIWAAAHENARIRAFAATVKESFTVV
ncbi:LysR family transcriptional regulator [Actinocrispum wychmicini]|uniref:DNA-binding transcriptional LysR family regulator n=1 Tax=Actinocrispum wychmicini TaxID=1213861 RepID=A0A4R2JMB9_9PSEU|nr:LysR family transcriptional regulator [Actinocrispum wychmicini]TCO58266.1 DNA-binding transcriptional LysR family regulator [Actinocrispum wychmicini]